MTRREEQSTAEWVTDQADRATPEPRYRLYRMSDAFEPRPPKEWIVEGWLAAGSVNLLVGEPGACKTWSMLHLSVCVALGAPWLGFDTTQGTALIIDEESGADRLRDRLRSVAAGLGAGTDPPVFFTSLAGFNLLEASDVRAVIDLMQKTGPRLVIIDALADVMLGGDENAVKDVQPVFARLRALADQYRAAVIVIHHANKSGDYRGSSAMLGAVDLMLTVERHEGKPLIFESVKYRDGDKVSFAAWPRFAQSSFELVTADGALTAPPMSDDERKVLMYLRDNGRSLLVDVCQNTRHVDAEVARQSYYRLEKKGLAYRVDEGTQGTRATIALTDRGRGVADVL